MSVCAFAAVDGVGVLSRALRLVEGFIRPAVERFKILPGCENDARRSGYPDPFVRMPFIQAVQEALQPVADIAFVGGRNQQGEFVAAEPSGYGFRSKRAAYRIPDFSEYLVAADMPERVVHLFEIVDVKQRHRGDGAFRPALFPKRREPCFQRRSWYKAR